MARLVVPRPITGQFAAQPLLAQAQPDGYVERLVKYIPAESVAFYLCVDRIISSHFDLNFSIDATSLLPNAQLVLCSWTVFCLALVGTPLYLWKRRLEHQPWKLHATLSTIAFVLWAYSLGGSIFLIYGVHSFLIAGLVAPIFTFIAGLFEPEQI